MSHDVDEHTDRRANGVVEQLQRQVTGVDLRVVRVEGKLDTIAVQLEGHAEQRERMEATLHDIATEFKAMNGRTRKNEDNIAALQFGHSTLMQELTRTLSMQPDGTVSLTLPIRPPLAGKQKAVVATVLVPLVLGGIDLIRHGIELAVEWLKHGAAR